MKKLTKDLQKFYRFFVYVETRALFSSKKFYKIDTVALSFVFDKNCPIMD